MIHMNGDALRSWSDGPAKTAILDFLAAVTKDGGRDYRPLPDRVAVFDNDGTLWCEQPMPVELLFASTRITAMADEDPSLRAQQPFTAFLEQDHLTLHRLGKRALLEVGMAVHAGSTVRALKDAVVEWMISASHPAFDRQCHDLVYQPQMELLALLREHGFTTYVVSAGDTDFIRAAAAPLYGIPPEQVIGSTMRVTLEGLDRDRSLALIRRPELASFNDGFAKPANIWQRIGRRPLVAFGSSDGDLAMLRYTMAGRGRRLALLLHHDDPDREVAYDRDYALSPLSEALDRAGELRIHTVSMRNDWNVVMRRLQRADGKTIGHIGTRA
jgi:hypothetical protein